MKWLRVVSVLDCHIWSFVPPASSKDLGSLSISVKRRRNICVLLRHIPGADPGHWLRFDGPRDRVLRDRITLRIIALQAVLVRHQFLDAVHSLSMRPITEWSMNPFLYVPFRGGTVAPSPLPVVHSAGCLRRFPNWQCILGILSSNVAKRLTT